MPKKFANEEERRKYWNAWHEKNKSNNENYKTHMKDTKVRLRDEKRAWYFEYKKMLSCDICNVQDYRVLEFHHKDPLQKDIAVANMIRQRVSKEKIMEEIAKCQVLCANCHRITHWDQRENKLEEID